MKKVLLGLMVLSSLALATEKGGKWRGEGDVEIRASVSESYLEISGDAQGGPIVLDFGTIRRGETGIASAPVYVRNIGGVDVSGSALEFNLSSDNVGIVSPEGKNLMAELTPPSDTGNISLEDGRSYATTMSGKVDTSSIAEDSIIGARETFTGRTVLNVVLDKPLAPGF